MTERGDGQHWTAATGFLPSTTHNRPSPHHKPKRLYQRSTRLEEVMEEDLVERVIITPHTAHQTLAASHCRSLHRPAHGDPVVLLLPLSNQISVFPGLPLSIHSADATGLFTTGLYHFRCSNASEHVCNHSFRVPHLSEGHPQNARIFLV
ncbi:hypothetical protein M427DRAFT_476673 [Gonapodya prolifera JEL478]|uniref:Uncharacterized protein n=1 Tax=Gonapodya prolifera (strain JEL478) TaxID=1344416 RepID=A0A139A152_GONPJ|nr:hypothetical protein M427DRAFT_476673 [Gonapodya prolifera JEL478]|eukprot:KXS10454.1 hypothetical protein M427DRAFT_476673 [Gonapodya prolifera JEL478]